MLSSRTMTSFPSIVSLIGMIRLHDVFPSALAGLDEAPHSPLPAIPVLHEALIHRDPALHRVPEGRGPGRVGHGYHHVALDLLPLGENLADVLPGFVDAHPVDARRRMGEVGVLEGTVGALGSRGEPERLQIPPWTA